MDDIRSNFSEAESDNKHDEIITKVPNNENLIPCVVINMLDSKIQWCNSKKNWGDFGKWLKLGKLMMKKLK